MKKIITGQISEFLPKPNFRITTKFQNYDQISELRQNFKIMTNSKGKLNPGELGPGQSGK